MMSSVTVDYFGVSGTGRTVKQAKEDAGSKIRRVVKHVSPRVWTWRGWSVVVYVTPEGEGYMLIHPDDDGRKHCCSFGSDCEQSAVKHMLSNARNGEGDFELPEWLPNSVVGKDLIAEWKRNDKFQAAYRAARETGIPDHECHEVACSAMWSAA